MPHVVPARGEIPVEYTWDASSVFPSDAAWEAAITNLLDEVLPALAGFRGRLNEGPAILADYLALVEQVTNSVNRINVYATLFYAVDANDPSGVAKRDRAQAIAARVGAAMAFGEPELLAIGFTTLQNWLTAEPRLAVYAHYLDRLEHRQSYVRSTEIEEVLRQVNEAFSTASATHGILANADLRFAPASDDSGETYEIAQGAINALVTHPDRVVRRSAWESYADAHLALKNTMANCIAAGVKQNVFTARVRRYESALEASLHPNCIPLDVFHNLIATFRKHLPTWHRYWRIRRQALGYEQLYVYDCKAPLTKQPLKVTYAQAIDWISTGMQPLGAEYVDVMKRGLTEQRWVDVFPNQGKRAGAFSMGAPGTHPFIMMSYNDDIFSMSTLAHELGHSMHSHYTFSTQPIIYARYGLFLAEVASNFNQALVRDHLLNTSNDRDFQIAIIEEAMANFHRYFFIMPTLARFEQEIHERVERGQALTATSLIALMADLFAEGYGDEVVMDRERVGITWAEFSTHMYANFYVYQYATGISAAHALADRVLSGAPDAVERYLGFLKAGGSQYPLDILKHAGVDMTTPEPVERTFGVLANLVDRLEKLLQR
ncbi:MAG: oligoendopeptidase F [Chloroflexales bacterium]|nr:oligoendopeptidase F [Chloroflexales bacterium]